MPFRNITLASGERTTKRMHQFLTDYAPMTDHRDGNWLNNCRYDMRPATNTQETGITARRTRTARPNTRVALS